MEEFFKNLGIEDYTETDKGLRADIADSNEWDKIKSKLDKCHAVRLDEDNSQYSYDSWLLRYTGELYDISLIGDLNSNEYRITIAEED